MNNDFAPFRKRFTSFIVKNIANPIKVVRIFNYPIPPGTERDLLQIPGVGEADLRVSLLKGELQRKILANEITITESDIDLLQFNSDQRAFLQNAGIDFGIAVTSQQMSVRRQEDIVLIGDVNDSNQIFTVPSGTFIQDSTHKIIVYKNGVKQAFLDDYYIAESGGPGTGYDTVIMTVPPTTVPAPSDIITADYYVSNL